MALPMEWGVFKSFCEALALENHCIPRLAVEAKELQKRSTDHK